MAYRVIKELGDRPVGTIINDETYAQVILAGYDVPHLELIKDEPVLAPVVPAAEHAFFGKKKGK